MQAGLLEENPYFAFCRKPLRNGMVVLLMCIFLPSIATSGLAYGIGIELLYGLAFRDFPCEADVAPDLIYSGPSVAESEMQNCSCDTGFQQCPAGTLRQSVIRNLFS